MKPYNYPLRVHLFSLLLLVASAALAGLLIGVLAHYLSTLLYYLVIFPLVIGGASGIVFVGLAMFSKIRHSWLTAVLGAGMGLVVALAFYATPYWGLQRQVINEIRSEYPGSTSQDAIAALDDWLWQETGNTGLFGYMKLQANAGQNIDNALLVNGVPITFLNFNLRSGWAWAYWLLETLLFSIPVAILGYLAGKDAFNESANAWYVFTHTLATAPAGNQDGLLAAFQQGQAAAAGGLLTKGDDLPHPRIELDEHRTKKRKGNILLVVRATRRGSDGNVRRAQVGAWEVSPTEYKLLSASLQNLPPEPDDLSLNPPDSGT